MSTNELMAQKSYFLGCGLCWFMENFKVNTDFLVSIGMDGPNVNKSFERKLVKKLEKDKGIVFSLLACVYYIL